MPAALHPALSASAVEPWLRATAQGVELSVLVQPRASRSQVVGLHDGRLKIQLAAPPIDGAANAALIELLSETVPLARRDVHIARGESSRRKTVVLRGAVLDVVARALGGDLR